ncbi:MAG: hypothetical protein RL268_164 [Pseudomonadota bacterium]|jgi:hypothetical protein
MPSRILRTEADREAFQIFLQGMKLPATIEYTQGADRSSEQNRLQFLWSHEAAQQRGDVTFEEVRHEWKLRYGVPILRRDSAGFRAVYDKMLKPLGYTDKLELMAYMPVTSEFSVRQMIEYLDTVQRETLQQGIVLTDPDPDLAAYHSRYRMKPAA